MGTVATIVSGTTPMATAATNLNLVIASNNTVGQYSCNVTAALATTPTAIAFDSNDVQAGVFTHSTSTNNTRFTVSAAGIYRFTAQLQVNHLTTGTAQAVSYFRKNGTTEVPNSTARWSSNGVADTGVLVVDVIVAMAASDYIELMAFATVVSEWNVLATAASGTSPTAVPVTPAVILTAIAFPA